MIRGRDECFRAQEFLNILVLVPFRVLKNRVLNSVPYLSCCFVVLVYSENYVVFSNLFVFPYDNPTIHRVAVPPAEGWSALQHCSIKTRTLLL